MSQPPPRRGSAGHGCLVPAHFSHQGTHRCLRQEPRALPSTSCPATARVSLPARSFLSSTRTPRGTLQPPVLDGSLSPRASTSQTHVLEKRRIVKGGLNHPPPGLEPPAAGAGSTGPGLARSTDQPAPEEPRTSQEPAWTRSPGARTPSPGAAGSPSSRLHSVGVATTGLSPNPTASAGAHAAPREPPASPSKPAEAPEQWESPEPGTERAAGSGPAAGIPVTPGPPRAPRPPARATQLSPRPLSLSPGRRGGTLRSTPRRSRTPSHRLLHPTTRRRAPRAGDNAR